MLFDEWGDNISDKAITTLTGEPHVQSLIGSIVIYNPTQSLPGVNVSAGFDDGGHVEPRLADEVIPTQFVPVKNQNLKKRCSLVRCLYQRVKTPSTGTL